MHAGIGVAGVECRIQRQHQIVDGGTVPNDGVVKADRGRHAVAELRRVLDVVGSGAVVLVAAQQERRDVAGRTLPRVCIGGRRFAEGESCELQEEIRDGDIALARLVQQTGVGAEQRRAGEVRGVDRAAALGGELEFGRAVGADRAIFGAGPGIDRKEHARTVDEIVMIAVLLPGVAVPRRLAMGAAGVEGDVGAQITAELDAGVGAGNVEEAGTIQRADPDILDRPGFDRQVGGLRAADHCQTRRCPQKEMLRDSHPERPGHEIRPSLHINDMLECCPDDTTGRRKAPRLFGPT